jgi:hypothetical protein
MNNLHKSRGILAVCAAVLAVGCSFAPPAPVVSKDARGEIVGGYVVHPDKTEEGQVAQQRAIARKQEEELRRQERERDDIERQQIYDGREQRYLQGRDAADDARTVGSEGPVQDDAASFVPEPPVKELSRRKRY